MNERIDDVEGQKLPCPQWEKPALDVELGEVERTAQHFGISQEVLIEAYKKAELQVLSDADWDRMLNSDSRDTTWTLAEIRGHLKGKRDFDRIEQGIRAGSRLPAPVVLYRNNEPPYLIGGNSRLLACRALGLTPFVLALRLS